MFSTKQHFWLHCRPKSNIWIIFMTKFLSNSQVNSNWFLKKCIRISIEQGVEILEKRCLHLAGKIRKIRKWMRKKQTMSSTESYDVMHKETKYSKISNNLKKKGTKGMTTHFSNKDNSRIRWSNSSSSLERRSASNVSRAESTNASASSSSTSAAPAEINELGLTNPNSVGTPKLASIALRECQQYVKANCLASCNLLNTGKHTFAILPLRGTR